MKYWMTLWDSVMKNDTQTLNKTLDLSGWQVESNDHWELYDIIVRFKRFDCIQVYLTKVPYWYLKDRWFREEKLNYGKLLRGLIRDEAHKRAHIKALISTLHIPDIANIIWSYVHV